MMKVQFFTSLCSVSKIKLFDQNNVSIIILVDIVFIFTFKEFDLAFEAIIRTHLTKNIFVDVRECG